MSMRVSRGILASPGGAGVGAIGCPDFQVCVFF